MNSTHFLNENHAVDPENAPEVLWDFLIEEMTPMEYGNPVAAALILCRSLRNCSLTGTMPTSISQMPNLTFM